MAPFLRPMLSIDLSVARASGPEGQIPSRCNLFGAISQGKSPGWTRVLGAPLKRHGEQTIGNSGGPGSFPVSGSNLSFRAGEGRFAQAVPKTLEYRVD